MMKRCELCKSTAKVYCESDMASLCWSCDAKVHSANFLVARHSRSLLCQICQSPTPWSASGEKLWPSTASICGRCVVEDISDNDDEIGTEGDDEFDGNDYGDELESEVSVDENDNQVVPWSSTPPPPAASSSSSEGRSIADGGVSLKRKRQSFSDLTSEDDVDCSSANINHLTPSSRMPEPDETTSLRSTQSISETTAGKLKRIHRHNIISGDYICAPVDSPIKSTGTVELDLNLSL
ncbi:hypothetical protein L2E82_10763 [Cichorium intybus]|uniref:Uncharacterized protein n=1 Tax=Cichorium intybus TaxID=13427 RepID=A0ACB9GBB1_CICIN|nr:hypothetical protein L2E82_10763 [Cichorium intybus]